MVGTEVRNTTLQLASVVMQTGSDAPGARWRENSANKCSPKSGSGIQMHCALGPAGCPGELSVWSLAVEGPSGDITDGWGLSTFLTS